ncbi:MAG: four helix bundle protein [Acidobacteriota bacterium]|jgi:four helix bundle protein
MRRCKAWREAFEVAVEVFRVTGALDDRRTGGLRSRMRNAAVRVPALLSRAASRRAPAERRRDLKLALGCLEQVETGLRTCLALAHAGPGELRHITQRLEATRGEIARLGRPDGPDPLDHGADPLARDSLQNPADGPSGG